jgi:hypothetical protein
MKEYYVLTASPYLKKVYAFIQQHDLSYEVHLNRTRFWINTDSESFTEFALRWADHCPPVESHDLYSH